jgi:hypothetical protein
VKLADQWREIERKLPADWHDARLLLRVSDPSQAERAAAMLTPLTPGRHRNEIRFYAARRGAGAGPDAVARLLGRLDREGIKGELELLSAGKPAAPEPEAQPVEAPRLADAWEQALSVLPPDWSDLYVELELTSTDHLDRAALLLSPVNPAGYGGKPGFRFRVARCFGYGASPAVMRRCLERLDDDGISGQPRILRVLSDTDPVGTQGPVWYVEGKAV